MVRLGAFGDVVRTLPAAWALRRAWPDAHLAWLVEPGAAPLLERLPWLDEVIVFPRPALERALEGRRAGELLSSLGGFRAALRARRFDGVVDFHGILKSGVLAWQSGAPRRVGPAGAAAREGAAFFYTEGVRLPSATCSRFERNAVIARALGARVDGTRVPGLADGGGSRGTHAVLHPGTSPGTPYKRWPVERFVELARRLEAELGAPCLVTCGVDDTERADAEALVAAAGGAARIAPTEGDIGALIEALAAARLVVSGDTGPLHLASLVGTPVVQILGPTHPVQNEPWVETPWARAHLPLPCSPCRNGCEAAPCLRQLPVSDVIDAVRRVLSAAAARPSEPDALRIGALR